MLDKSLYNTEEVVNLLRLEEVGTDRYLGQSHFMGSPNVFGGQVLGQSLYAAAATVENRRPHSSHSLFLLPGNHRLPIEYEVERVRDGGSFSTRRVVAFQEGKRIFVSSVSFQQEESGLEHQRPAPAMPAPETVPSSVPRWKAKMDQTRRGFQPVPVDFRASYEGDIFAANSNVPHKQMWLKSPLALPDDPLLHEALFAYVSDYGLLWTALQPHGIKQGDPRLQIASLDHSIWFHRPFRMDEWLLFSMESPNAAGGRGLSFAHVYNEKGDMVASMTQEGLIRIREKK
jgi:acyl-CoA thioesterase-2